MQEKGCVRAVCVKRREGRLEPDFVFVMHLSRSMF